MSERDLSPKGPFIGPHGALEFTCTRLNQIREFERCPHFERLRADRDAALAREAKLREALDALVNADRLYGDMLPTRLWDAARAALAETEPKA